MTTDEFDRLKPGTVFIYTPAHSPRTSHRSYWLIQELCIKSTVDSVSPYWKIQMLAGEDSLWTVGEESAIYRDNMSFIDITIYYEP